MRYKMSASDVLTILPLQCPHILTHLLIHNLRIMLCEKPKDTLPFRTNVSLKETRTEKDGCNKVILVSSEFPGEPHFSYLYIAHRLE